MEFLPDHRTTRLLSYNNCQNILIFFRVVIYECTLYPCIILLNSNLPPMYDVYFLKLNYASCSVSESRFVQLRFYFSPGPGLGAPLSSYLEVMLYKFHR